LKERMYEGMAETWREWGRSLDLKDAASAAQVWWDLAFLALVQGLPWVLVPGLWLVQQGSPAIWSGPLLLLWAINLGLLVMRVGMQAAVASAYDLRGAPGAWAFWLSPLADPVAVLRIGLSSLRRPTQWRGRQYST
ncbi:glycosyl transferase, partial [filamentous cyanobacterium CCP4]